MGRRQAELGLAIILGGRWDGLEVEYHGSVVTFKEGTYVALRRRDGRCFYLLESLIETWFSNSRRTV